jgi:hypothetical protein
MRRPEQALPNLFDISFVTGPILDSSAIAAPSGRDYIVGLLDDAKENVAEGFDKAKDTAENAGEFVKDKAGEVGEFAKDTADDVADFVKDKADEVKDRFDGDDEAATPPAATPPAS